MNKQLAVLGPSKWARMITVLGLLLGLLGPLSYANPASAASATGASFSGGAGTASVDGTLYAKQGASLTLTVTTDTTTKCVRVTDGTTSIDKDSSSAQTSWTFTSADSAALFTAGTGDGIKSVTATAYASSNNQHKCTANQGEKLGTQTASYMLDNTGPVVTREVSPAANAAGWNNSNVSITWSATDAGSGVGSGPTPASDSVTTDTAGVTKNATATDRVGNVGNGSVTVKLDKTAPTITGNRSPAANANGWNNTDVTVSFTCSDTPSGIKSCSGPTTLSSSAANQSVTGTAVDNADNSASTTVSGINIDKVAPTLSGAPTTSPNANGWYNGNVTIHWTASDALSGLAGSTPADSTISSEGSGLTASASVSDKAGNSTNATSSPAVNIDKTAPNTTATAPANWNNTDVTVSLNPTDAMSGVAATYYTLDGGAQQSGTSVAISAEGIHTLQFWSVDNAGNTETAKSAQVKIDKTPPTINHTQSPAANANGWNKTDVTVTFVCGDALSGIASCTSPQTVNTEGQNQAVTGTATDNAGNSATDPAKVSIDKTAPTISAAADRAANGNGWYNADVTVSFTCGDSLSGVANCPASQTLGEGANQSTSGTATDAAGNTSSAGVSGINIDKTAPSLSGVATSTPNANGWYSGDVSIHWTASDALSGLVGSAPGDSLITGEGDNLSASATVNDLAGNLTSSTVSGIKIDRTAPTTLASVPDPLTSGWYAGDVLVTLTTGADLSGVDKTYYSVDGGAAQVYSGPLEHTLKGIHTITFWSVDKAGNVEDNTAPGHSITIRIDGVPPTITGSRTPAANANGWNNGPVTVSFNCSDAESSIAGCSDPVTLSNEGAGQSVVGQAQDNAGNTASATVDNINIDLTAPTITGAATTSPNANGWYNGPVTVHFTCADQGAVQSGIATCPVDVVLSTDGANQSVQGTVTDKAGNTNSTTVSGINIDKVAPTLSGAPTTSPNANGWYNGNVTVHWTVSDDLSEIDPATQPPDSAISSEGTGLKASASVSDKAGNSTNATSSPVVNIDKTAPNTTATSPDGWKNNDVTVSLNATDNLSGVVATYYTLDDGAQQSGTSVAISAEGTHTLQFWSVDNAGNTETAKSAQVKIDRTAPTINHTQSPAANGKGWNNTDVTVTFTCADTDGSGVASCTVPQTVTTEGKNQAVTGTATDNAGNSATDPATVSIDKTAPTISAAPDRAANGAGWYNADVTVNFTCGDALSGIASCPGSKALGEGANQSASGTATDAAGNIASSGVSGINIDKTAPGLSGAATTAPNGNGWYKEDVNIHWTGQDGLSGIDPATQPADSVITGEGSNLGAGPVSISDKAGNVGSGSVSGFKIDRTAPTITGAATTSPNANGWYNGPVTVHFTCADQGAVQSGIATCPADVVLSTDGPNQSVPGTAVDYAGNTASVTITGINIDSVKPAFTSISVVNGAIYTLGDPAIPSGTPTCTATDNGAGVASCKVTVTGGTPNGVGTFSFTATATDKAGNSTTQPGSYRVIYRWDGFQQPINDTAHQVDLSVSIFKGGSTVPVKFQLKKADGTIVQANTLPQWVTPTKGSPTTGAVDETVYSDSATNGSTYRWDSTAQQYIYNWSTKGSALGYFYRIGVTLDDGQTYYVNIGLR